MKLIDQLKPVNVWLKKKSVDLPIYTLNPRTPVCRVEPVRALNGGYTYSAAEAAEGVGLRPAGREITIADFQDRR